MMYNSTHGVWFKWHKNLSFHYTPVEGCRDLDRTGIDLL